jgi:16S rRNA (guanine527-N7)-methyltransferase
MASDERRAAARAAAWANVPWDESTEAALSRYAEWLATEGIAAGGLGPDEGDRLWHRHIADSLLFAGGRPSSTPPPDLIDVGSGLGLPGIPLALVWPACQVVLLERSGRRAGLLRRVVRILGVDNVAVIETDVRQYRDRAEMVTFRASLPPPRAFIEGRRLCRPGGTVVVGLSWSEDAAAPPGVEVITVPPAVLDSPIRLLRMTVHDA